MRTDRLRCIGTMLKAAAGMQRMFIHLLQRGRRLVRCTQAVLRLHQAAVKHRHDHSQHPHPEGESQKIAVVMTEPVHDVSTGLLVPNCSSVDIQAVAELTSIK